MQLYARGLCSRDYMRALRTDRLDEFQSQPRICAGCGVSFKTGSRNGNKYCTTACLQTAFHAERKRERDVVLEERRCVKCGHPVPLDYRSDARHCSVSCQQASWYDDNDERLRASAGVWKSTHRELANEYQHRRRAVIQGADAVAIDWAEVWVRDLGICWICEHPVDPTLRHPDRMRRSLDHVIPIAKGGPHTMNNVAIAHLRCNISKNDKVLDRVPRALVGLVMTP